MKYFERVIALTALVITVMVSSTVAFAQERQTLVNIPFNFTVGDKALPAGEYLIRRNRKDADSIWVIQHKDSGKAVLFQTRQVHSAETKGDAKFVFRKYDDLYFLSEFWTAGTNTGREIQVTDRERAMQKALAVAPTVHVLIDRGGK
jgi:hypothetical protein